MDYIQAAIRNLTGRIRVLEERDPKEATVNFFLTDLAAGDKGEIIVDFPSKLYKVSTALFPAAGTLTFDLYYADLSINAGNWTKMNVGLVGIATTPAQWGSQDNLDDPDISPGWTYEIGRSGAIRVTILTSSVATRATLVFHLKRS